MLLDVQVIHVNKFYKNENFFAVVLIRVRSVQVIRILKFDQV